MISPDHAVISSNRAGTRPQGSGIQGQRSAQDTPCFPFFLEKCVRCCSLPKDASLFPGPLPLALSSIRGHLIPSGHCWEMRLYPAYGLLKLLSWLGDGSKPSCQLQGP